MTFGLDVSKFQGNIRWNEVPLEMSEFVWVRAKGSEGGRDERFFDNYLGAAFNGGHGQRMVGPYGFARWTEDPVEWAMDLADYVGEWWSPLNMAPLLDLEAPHAHQTYERTYFEAMTPEEREEWAYLAARTLTEMMSKPIIYTGYNFWKTYMGQSSLSSDTRVVLARYSFLPGDIYHSSFGDANGHEPWSTWHGHQFTSQGRVPGINENVDRIYLNKGVSKFDLMGMNQDRRLENLLDESYSYMYEALVSLVAARKLVF